MVRVWLLRLEYQLEVKVWLYREKMHREYLKLKPSILNRVSIYMYLVNVCIITVYLYQTACVKVAVTPALE